MPVHARIMNDRGHLDTERRNPASLSLDRLSVSEAFDIMSAEDHRVAPAVAAAKPHICRAVALVVEALKSGGRLIYVGAGTSGRLGVLDAAECPPTFLTDPAMVVGVIAGGDEALRRSVEGAEDDEETGAAEMDRRCVGSKDVVFGISSGGTTPYVAAALRRARQLGARTVFLACVPYEQCPDEADVSIRVLTGPEVLTGSTRLKAGTATKMVLNMITTLSMARLGKVYQNLMVDVNTAANAKLVDRGIRILREITGLSREASADLLQRASGRVKTAIVMHRLNLDRPAADARLSRSGGDVARATSEP